MKKNGLILFPQMQINLDKQTASVNGKVPKTDYLSAALYWDDIIYLNNNALHAFNKGIEEFRVLEEEGVLKEIDVKISHGGDMFMDIYEGVNKKVVELITSDEMIWVANKLDKYFLSSRGLSNDGGGELLSLVNALPIPSSDTNIHQILEFKLARKDQLTSLRIAIAELELKVMSSENKELALRGAIIEIDKACHDLIMLYKESRLKFDLGNITFNFSQASILKAFGAAGVAYAAVKNFDIPETAAVIASVAYGVSSFIEVKPSISLKKIDKTNPFIYAAEAVTKLN
ncbi:TPA: DUF6236 family protein [Raoultella ornithinolytica]